MKNPTPRQRYHGPLQAVILDWAGTTVDFGSCAPVDAFVAAFRSLDVTITREQARAPMGKAKREHIQAILEQPSVGKQWRQVHGTDLHDAIDRVFDRFMPIQLETLQQHADLIPGCIDAVDACRSRNVKIGSSTGYSQELLDVLAPLAAKQGYQPDALLCASDVSPGRPAPWMIFENARRLAAYPMASVIKVDDTIVGIEAGLNAGAWTVGVAATGNMVGLSRAEFESLPDDVRAARIEAASEALFNGGAHFVIDSVELLPSVLDEIQDALSRGEQP